MEHRDTDLSDVERELRRLNERLREMTAPLRAQMLALGPGGLFALAAEETAFAEAEPDPARRRLHLQAARAAEALADALATERASAP